MPCRSLRLLDRNQTPPLPADCDSFRPSLDLKAEFITVTVIKY